MSAKETYIKNMTSFYFGDVNILRKALALFAGELYDAKQLGAMEVNVITANATLDEGDVNKLHIVTADSVITLPATSEGLRFFILNGAVDGAAQITISPNASDMIKGSFSNGEKVIRMTGTDNKDIVNTKATAKNGDFIVLNADDSAGYYIENGTGIWVEESTAYVGPLATQVTVTDNTVLTAADSGKTFNCATDEKAFTLPAITTATIGMKFKFRNTADDGDAILTISPNASDGINGTIANAAADSVASGEVNKDLVNTKSTANNGDYVEIEAVALTKWYITGGVGIWASEA